MYWIIGAFLVLVGCDDYHVLLYMYGMYNTRNTIVDVIGNEVCSHSSLLFVLLLVLTFEF